jgi:hypothetical protein
MLRFYLATFAAAVLVSGAGPSLAAVDEPNDLQVTVDKAGVYCISTPAVGAELVAPTDCRSASDWAKAGVTFSRR